MQKDVLLYHNRQSESDREICGALYKIISKQLPGAGIKVWHAHPVWFINENPIVGYSKLKSGVRLMFWSGLDFDEEGLRAGTGKFKDASVTYNSPGEINKTDLKRWLEKSKTIQWDYKNLVKRKGRLRRVKTTG